MNATSLPPAHEDEAALLDHGAGGRMTGDLLDTIGCPLSADDRAPWRTLPCCPTTPTS